MEKFPKNKEVIPKFEVRVSSYSDKDRIISKLSRGGIIQFIVTKSRDIWLTDKGHDEMRIKDDILWEDIDFRGYFARRWGFEVGITYYDEFTRDKNASVEKSIRNAIENFIK